MSFPVDENVGSGRHDRWGRYLIVPPGGSKEVAYTRVTTVAKALDDGGGLAPWKASMACTGLLMRRGLRAQWEALLAEHPNPWYDSPEGKKRCKRLVEECAAVGGANDRREVGTALHAITALVDLGKTPPHLAAETEAGVRGYRDGLARAGVEIVPGHVEVTVVLDDHRVAGTFDRLVTLPDFDRPLVADLKTGANLAYSWQSIAVQLAAYARANAIYQQGATAADDVRCPMPDVDRDHGLVVHLNADTNHLELHLVDIVSGWEAFEQSMWVREWRQHRHLASPYGQAPAVEKGVVANPPVPQAAPAEAPTPMRDRLQQRIDTVGEFSPEARTALATLWPADLPTLKTSDAHTHEQLHDIEQLLDRIEAEHRLPFADPNTLTSSRKQPSKGAP